MTPRAPLIAAGVFLLLGAGSVLASNLSALRPAPALRASGEAGDPARGRDLLPRYGCPSCHVIPHVPGADATVGPPLDGVGRRVYVGGRPNKRANVVAFLRQPSSPDRRSPMPDVGLDERDATDVAAFLETLR